MEIELDKSYDITLKEAEIINTDKLTFNEITDNGTSVIITFSVGNGITEKTKRMILWEGQDYIDIDQWTDKDVQNRVQELLNIKSK